MSLLERLIELREQPSNYDEIRSSLAYRPFWRQFSVSGLSSASKGNYNLSTLNNGVPVPRRLMLAPHPGESSVLIRRVTVTINDDGAWGPGTLGSVTALPEPGLSFALFRAGVQTQDFDDRAGGGFITNMAFVRSSDDTLYFASGPADDAARFTFDFSVSGRNPIYLNQGDFLAWTLSSAASLGALDAFVITATGLALP